MAIMTPWQFIFVMLIASACRLIVDAKVFERCELASVLHQRHRLDLKEVAQWVCIAQHASGLNTAAQAKSRSGGSHGLFQISDVYWCSPPGEGAGCNLSCEKLRDEDLSDDLSCLKRIYSEHQYISGDGYTAWNAYQQYCKSNAFSYIEDCFSKEQKEFSQPSSGKRHKSVNALTDYSTKKIGKVYERCELARELHGKHKVPMQQIPTWVCIAEHESHLNTAAVGHFNADGSADHGLFQISDLYWCSHDRFSSGGKACGLPCSKYLDNDITDDVHCIKRIYSEHAAISGDGFTAWTVYKPYCQNQEHAQIASCFSHLQGKIYKIENYGLEMASNQIQTITKLDFNSENPFLKHIPTKTYNIQPSYNDIFHEPSYLPGSGRISHMGKIYTRCSLAQELYFKHSVPIQDISTWVCIAEHESQFNTAAVGYANTDGSADHGLFQISDRYWCDHSTYGGKACNLPCKKLLDDDIRDDVACIRTIHEEHTRISGDGFNAWTVYKPYCQNQLIEHIKICFDEKTLATFETMQPSPSFNVATVQGTGKIYNKCELAEELYHKHNVPLEQIPKWVCIAEHQSSFNTAAVGRLNTDGSANYGLFQISDLYWCSHDQNGGKACNIPCHKLLDSDISDDIKCIKIIYEEHTRISGDGFNAWTVYKSRCHSSGIEQIKTCFNEKDIQSVANKTQTSLNSFGSTEKKSSSKGKIYSKCELAKELYNMHHMAMEEIPKWVCIAQYESSFNTAAVGRLNSDGSADHGLFQISDLYWCSHDEFGGKACNMPCHKLLDSDITDDVKCIKIIHEEHTRLSGDGFNAWTVYKPHCRNTGISHVKECFTEKELKQSQDFNTTLTTNAIEPSYGSSSPNIPKGKIYKKCELANELLVRHKMPMEQIPTWVCIAQKESSFNTAAVGRLNRDGSLDHGLFQISDLYWCSHDQFGGKACNMPCHKFLDSDITDDVKCIKIIHEEHTRLSGDGFNAWTVYKPHCRNTEISHVKECFTEKELKQHQKFSTAITTNSIEPFHGSSKQNARKGKIYKKCELTQELLVRHKIPMEQIPTWVCIAQHESSFNTAAVGRLNTDGSLNYGLFQISDLYWCSHDKYGGKACNIPCHKLLDADITDDVKCIKTIHDEHTRISGDGFNAWAVYKPHCRNRQIEEIRGCLTSTQIEKFSSNQVLLKKDKNAWLSPQGEEKVSFSHNPFLSGLKPSFEVTKKSPSTEKSSYHNNPFLQNVKITSGSQIHKSIAHSPNFLNNKNLHNYQDNPFLRGFLEPTTSTQNKQQNSKLSGNSKPLLAEKHQVLEISTKAKYKHNPFLNGEFSSKAGSKSASKPTEKLIDANAFKNNPFLNGEFSSQAGSKSGSKPTEKLIDANAFKNNPFLSRTKFLNSEAPAQSSTPQASVYQNQKIYVNANDFRKTTTSKPKTTSAVPSTPTNATKKSTLRTTTQQPATKPTKNTTTIKISTKPLKQTVTSTTKIPTTTTQKSVTNTTTTKSFKSTIASKVLNQKTSSKSQKTQTTRNWQTQSYKNSTTTTKPTKTTTTRQEQIKDYHSLSITKPPAAATTAKNLNKTYFSNGTLSQSTTTARPFMGTTWNWKNEPKSTTTKPFASTENWRKWDKTTTKNYKTTTSKQQISTENGKKSDRTTTETPRTTRVSHEKYRQTPTPTKPVTSTENWRKWDRTTVKKSSTKTVSPEETTTNSVYRKTEHNLETTSTDNWKRWDKTTTTRPNTITTNLERTSTRNWRNDKKFTTTKPLTSTQNWRKWDRTDRTTTKKSTTTTPSPEKTTWNWRKEKEFTTTTEDWRKWDRTTRKSVSMTSKKPVTTTTTTKTPRSPNNLRTTTTKTTTSRPKMAVTNTAKPTRSENFKSSSTKPPFNYESYKTTTRKPPDATANSLQTDSRTEFDKYKTDPFSHPFFSKVKEQFKWLHNNVTTKQPSFTAIKEKSPFKNAKPVVAHNFGNSNSTTTKRPRP